MDPEPPRGAAFSPRSGAALLLGVAVSMAFLGFMLFATEGHFVAQVPDLYLVCQYARAMAEGHAFQYNAGEPGSTGATSLLFTVVLALAHAAGARGEGLVAFAIGLGIACYLATIALSCRVGARLGGPAAGTLAGALVALGGPVVWGFHYGSDIAPYMLLTLWTLAALLDGWTTGRVAAIALPATLLALARPEGLAFGLLLGAALVLGPARSARARLTACLPAVAGALVLVLYRWRTGLWLGTSIADKSLFANYGIAEGLGVLAEYATDVVRGLLLGFYPAAAPVGLSQGWAPYYFAPLSLLLVLLALCTVAETERRPLWTFAAIASAVAALVSPNVFLGVHFNRYLMWAFPVVHVLTAVGLAAAARMAARGDDALERRLFRGGALLALALALASTLRFGVLYGAMAGGMWHRDVAAANWISRNLPPGVAIANIATSVEYLTGHRNVNLHGVTSPAFFGNRTSEREAGVYESLVRLPAAERPAFLLTTASTQDALASMRAIVSGPPVFQTSSLSDEILVFRTRYDLLERGLAPSLPETAQAVAGLTLVDGLNVCDSHDEAAHRYRYESRLAGQRVSGMVRIEPYAPGGEPVGDAGRAILGQEGFDVRTIPRRDLVVVMRTAAEVGVSVYGAGGARQTTLGFPEAGIVLQAGGQAAGRLAFAPRAGWDERVIRIPAAQVAGSLTRLTLVGRYASFRYWFYQ
jgi:hypothetical protein